jgi:hypothetical protein
LNGKLDDLPKFLPVHHGSFLSPDPLNDFSCSDLNLFHFTVWFLSGQGKSRSQIPI